MQLSVVPSISILQSTLLIVPSSESRKYEHKTVNIASILESTAVALSSDVASPRLLLPTGKAHSEPGSKREGATLQSPPLLLLQGHISTCTADTKRISRCIFPYVLDLGGTSALACCYSPLIPSTSTLEYCLCILLSRYLDSSVKFLTKVLCPIRAFSFCLLPFSSYSF